jgi:very-short-patch-repair endonuclease
MTQHDPDPEPRAFPPELLARLGIGGVTIFEAGESGGQQHQRIPAIEAAGVVLGWFPDRSDLWWADIVYASTHGGYVVLASDGDVLWDAAGHLSCDAHILAPVTHEQARISAAALVLHDPSHEATHGMQPQRLAEMLLAAESPIEARLACHMGDVIHADSVCHVESQVPLLGGRYRADFVVTNAGVEAFADALEGYVYQPIRIVVEVDGHEWHERTKEQAARDKARDRELQIAGWKVLRFTGSEVWKDPAGCVRQLKSCIAQLGGSFT